MSNFGIMRVSVGRGLQNLKQYAPGLRSEAYFWELRNEAGFRAYLRAVLCLAGAMAAPHRSLWIVCARSKTLQEEKTGKEKNMGLFKNNKKICPICGSPTPRLFSTKVEKMPLCKECADKVDLPDGAIDAMSLGDFKQYLAFYEDNKRLRDLFSETYHYSFGLLSGSIVLDATHRLFRLKNYDNALVMEAANLKSFRILEDTKPLYESGKHALKFYPSDISGRAAQLAAQLEQLALQRRILKRMDGEQKDNDTLYNSYVGSGELAPFQYFYVELTLEHPYWQEFRWKVDAPTFDKAHPSMETYMMSYQRDEEELHTLAKNLMQII